MPYITHKRRQDLQSFDRPRTAGELNFILTRALIGYIKAKGLSYQTINDIKGVLIGVKDEFSRRVADPYEDLKIIQNGDVYQDVLPHSQDIQEHPATEV